MSESNPLIGQHVVVRTTNAGVHLGTLASQAGKDVVLNDARRLWRWYGAFTLNEVSQAGIRSKDSRIAAAVPTIALTEAIEIIPTSEAARATFDACHEQ